VSRELFNNQVGARDKFLLSFPISSHSHEKLFALVYFPNSCLFYSDLWFFPVILIYLLVIDLLRRSAKIGQGVAAP